MGSTEEPLFEQIVVPLDRSPVAEAALGPACLLAKRFEAPLLLVSTHAPLVTDEIRISVAEMVERLTKEGFSVRAMLPSVPPAEALPSELTLEPRALIVMTTPSHTGLGAHVHPWDTWKVFSHTAVPILACPYLEEQQTSPRLPVLRFLTDQTVPLLVALDGSLPAERALSLAQEWSEASGNPLVLVRAVEPVLAGSAWQTAALQWATLEAESYLKRKQVELTSAGLQVDIRSDLGLAPEVILESVQRSQAGLMVIGFHGWGWVGRLMPGTVVKSLLHQADVPVLLVRTRKAQEASVDGS